MRWLLVKDLQILRRSPLLVALLVLYPIVIGLLIGFALSRAPAKPRVALLFQLPAGQRILNLGNQRIDLAGYADQFLHGVVPLRVHSRREAVGDVRSGAALAALVIPRDFAAKLATGIQQPQVEVIYNGDALKQSYVQNTIEAELARVNAALSRTFEKSAAQDIGLLVDGGTLQTPIGSFDLLGLRRAERILRHASAALPRGSPQRAELAPVVQFASVALDGLGLARGGLRTVSRPVTVKRTLISGSRTPLDTFAVAVAVTLSLMFVCVLLAAGLLALEREEHAFGRLVRGLVSRTALLAEKASVAAACSFLVALVMLCGIGAFIGVEWGRFPRWLAALAVSGIAFGALGVALGAVAREVRVASLLALLLALPLAFLALVPNGAVASGPYDAIRVVSAIFPFKPALEAVDAAVNAGSGGLAGPLAHLAGLTLAFGVLARVALRRFA